MNYCKSLLIIASMALTLGAWLPRTARAQGLEALSLSSSLLVTQTTVRPYTIAMPPSYTLDTRADGGRYDDIGYRLAAAGRWRLGQAGLFVQPEVAYLATTGQYIDVRYVVPNLPGWTPFFTFSHRIKRWELAPLVGWHITRHSYILAGPLMALNLREADIPEKLGYPASDAIYNSLNRSVEPLQLAAQVGIGYLLGRLDFSLRIEQSLTPYTRQFAFEGNTYRYEQQIRQGLLTAGFLLYKRREQATPLTL